MKSALIYPTEKKLKIVRTEKPCEPGLSDNAFYLIILASELKKLLGPVSLKHFLSTGKSVVLTGKAV